MQKIGVIGAGTMGTGIAQVAAMAGHEVLIYEVLEDQRVKSLGFLQKILNRLADKGKISNAESKAIFGRIYFLESQSALEDCGMVIEAIIEDLEIKKAVFQNLEKIVTERCILASNTSSLSITSIAATCKHPERVVGIHFFNPAPLMKLVEIAPAIQTAETVQDQARNMIKSWGKLTVTTKDTPGFIVNRVARPFYSEALRILEEGLADFNTIDWAMQTIGGFRMGPFELMDYIGHDVNFAVTRSMWQSNFHEPRYKPAFTQQRLVEAGYLGRKTGRGFYTYQNGKKMGASPVEDPNLGQDIVLRILVMLINEASDALFWGIASREDIDLAMTRGVNYPKGLFQWADEIGINTIVTILDRLFDQYREERYRCSPLLRDMARADQSFYANT